MKIKPVWIAVLAVVVILGGIGLAQLAGLWHTSGQGGKGNGRNIQSVATGELDSRENTRKYSGRNGK